MIALGKIMVWVGMEGEKAMNEKEPGRRYELEYKKGYLLIDGITWMVIPLFSQMSVIFGEHSPGSLASFQQLLLSLFLTSTQCPLDHMLFW